MKLIPSDPDIETIIARIKSGDLDLQPDFQRGEVWPDVKKRRLIDTILRDWHIPPIHVIERPTSHKQEVLDGQQRLVAIRDFVNGLIRVDGSIEPIEEDISEAHNCTYNTLPPNLRRKFDRFTIRMFRLIDFKPDEPGELFFRLNQPTSLTAAEQRNAFFGPVREQVRKICEDFPSLGINSEVLGFTNSRMAFDDIVAKLCLTCERRSLRFKITAATITERYRSLKPIDSEIIDQTRRALWLFGQCAAESENRIKFNKATLFSWLCFLSRSEFESSYNSKVSPLKGFLKTFEYARSQIIHNPRIIPPRDLFPKELLSFFTDRSSLRVGDVSSVLLRDAVLSYCFISYLNNIGLGSLLDGTSLYSIYTLWKPLLASEASESNLLTKLESIEWGAIE